MFTLTIQTAIVRGLVTNNQTRLWVNDTELLPDELRKTLRAYSMSFTWGYNGAGPAFCAVAVSYGLVNDKHLARTMAHLIEDQYVIKWTFNEPFCQEINLVDFWTRNREAIHKAEIEARWLRRLESADERLRRELASYVLPEVPFSIRPEQIPLRIIYGDDAQVHWINFPTAVPGYSGRLRVDVYPLSGLYILTDIEESSVQNQIEAIIEILRDRFAINPLGVSLIQRYQHEMNLIHRVLVEVRDGRVVNPTWTPISTLDFQRIIETHQWVARYCPPRLAAVVSSIVRLIRSVSGR